jgi:methylglyoxal synthase
VTQAGDIASVLLAFEDAEDPANRWVDLHALLRVAGVWKITNKTATHLSRAGRTAAE